MNRIYRLIWTRVLNAWVVVIKTSRGLGKGPIRIIAALVLTSASAFAHAAPDGGQVIEGTGSISQSGTTTTINQASQNLSLNWKSFNIAPAETVNFVQPSTSAIAVNRIFDTNGTQILGRLNANGQVYLINPNGILFGQGSQVNVGALVASTLDFNDASLNGTTRTFSGHSPGSIVNQGIINATASGGYVALLGNTVSNQGTITTKKGSVMLGAGSNTTLTFQNDSLVKMQVDQNLLNTLADNGGLIRADGGLVLMSAGAKDALLASVVNNTGLIEARTVENHSGTIILLGGMAAGTVNVGGTLDASAPNGGDGGFIETSAAHVKIADDVKITIAAPAGNTGTWLIDPVDFTIAADSDDLTTSGIGATTLSNILASNNVSIATSADTAGNGDIFVNSAVSWAANKLTLSAHRNININADLNASATASLALNYGQGAIAAGNTSQVTTTSAAVNLPAGTANFTTLQGSDGAVKAYTVITSLGAANSLTTNDLQGMNGAPAANYALGSDIDTALTSTSAFGTTGFTPIGGFTGTLDGLGHTVSGLFINAAGTGNIGLIGSVGLGSVIRNVGMLGVSVSGGASTGALVGNNNVGTVHNSYATGNVSGAASTGGLVGSNTSGNISNSYATGNVFGAASTGGLVGSNTSGNISNSYATGDVNNSAAAGAGGLVGSNTEGNIGNSYATGNITGGASSGGLLGSNTNGATISSYATGNITGGASSGGLLGSNTNGAIISSYATGNVNGAAGTGGLLGSNTGGDVSNSYATGNVSNGTAASIGGLVGTITTGNINNTYATGSVAGGAGAGGLVGTITTGNITNTYATGSVAGGAGTGGLLGVGTTGVIANSYAIGAVSGGAGAGGLVGTITTGNITNTYATGSVAGAAGTGGLVGVGTTGVITNSYATGLISGAGAGRGGLIGTTSAVHVGSFWDTQTTGFLTSTGSGETGMTTAQMLNPLNFTTATAANGGVNPAWNTDSIVTLNSVNYPLLSSLFNNVATVTANNRTQIYQGAAYSSGYTATTVMAPGFTDPLSGTLSFSGSSQTGVDVGSYVITVGGLSYNNPQNVVTFVNGTLAIAKATATVTANSGNTSYSGLAQSVSGFTASGLVNGETASVLRGVSSSGTGTQAGSYNVLAAGTDSNYNLTLNNGALVIGKANAIVTANSSNATYSGVSQSVSGFTASGLVKGENASVLTSVSAIGSGTNAGTYNVIAAGTDSNYNLTLKNGALTIKPKALTVIGITALPPAILPIIPSSVQNVVTGLHSNFLAPQVYYLPETLSLYNSITGIKRFNSDRPASSSDSGKNDSVDGNFE
ncbi:MAG: filamentous hemagglutinin family protein [Chlamydiales bacterium]|jgi:filamentous hemagglutinin family protein